LSIVLARRYIFGDNEPYYVDANRLLKAMGLPQMSGNYSASNYLQPYSEASGKGYATHAVTTGISSKLCVDSLSLSRVFFFGQPGHCPGVSLLLFASLVQV
jgi:hypothetical protein